MGHKKPNISRPKGHNITLYKFMKKATRKKGVKINSRLTLFYTLDHLGKDKFYTRWIMDDGIENKRIEHREVVELYWLSVG